MVANVTITGNGFNVTMTNHIWLEPNDLVTVYKTGTGTATLRAISSFQVTKVSG